MAKLGEVFECQITGEWGKECSENESGIKVLRTTNFTSDGVINYTSVVERNISESKVEKKKLQFEDIILEKSGGTEKTPVGRVVYCDKTIENDVYLCNNFTQAMRVNKQIAFPRYIFYYMWFCHYSGKTELLQNKTTGIRNLQVKAYMNEEIELPNLEQQKKIVDKLDKIADCVNNRKSQLEKLDELVKSRFIEMFGDPQINPNGYKWVKLSEVATYFNGLTYKPENVAEVGTIVLRSSNIQNSQLDFADTVRVNCNLKEKFMVQENDILMCSRNGSARLVGKVALLKEIQEPMTFGAFMMIIRSSYYSYLMVYFQMDAFRQQIKSGATTTINQITGRMLDDVTIPLPPMKLIDQFAAFVAQVDKSKLVAQRGRQQLKFLLSIKQD